jgi:hypothetical protein
MLTDFIFDFETRSHLDLRKVGVTRYSTHPSTEVTLITWCFGRTGVVKFWRQGMPIPPELMNVVKNPHVFNMVAFNLSFDYMIWINVFSRQFDGELVRPPIKNLTDAAALASNYRCGNSLDATAQMMRLPISKDQEGRRIMLKQCKPNSKGVFPTLTDEEWKKFIHYGMIDTRILRDVYYMMPPLPAAERWCWEWTFNQNNRGIRLDMPLVFELKKIVDTNLGKLEREFDHLVNYQVKMGSPKRIQYFAQWIQGLTSMDAESIRDILENHADSLPPHILRAIQIIDLAGSSSIKKLNVALEQNFCGRYYQTLAYSYTQTKRFAGRGIQIHNFPRADDKPLDVIPDCNVEDLASVVRMRAEQGLKDPIGFVVNLLRKIWLPDEGTVFYGGDFSKIEPTTLFWLLDMGAIPKKWYEEMAAAIYGIDATAIGKESIERQIGKKAALSCNYGSGWKSFRDQVKKDVGLVIEKDLAKKSVRAFRKKYPLIKQFWEDLEIAFVSALRGNAVALCGGKVHFVPMVSEQGTGVKIRLPSGNYLYYHGAQVKLVMEYVRDEDDEIVIGSDGKPKMVMRQKITYKSDESGRIVDKIIYGGLICENVVSATARDVLIPSMFRLEEAGFKAICSVHDEVWALGAPGRYDEFIDVMCQRPYWCQTMDIAAEGNFGVRYLK